MGRTLSVGLHRVPLSPARAACTTGFSPEGGKYACISNTGCGCTTGLCVQKCNKCCTLSSAHAGRMAAPGGAIRPGAPALTCLTGKVKPGQVVTIDGTDFVLGNTGELTFDGGEGSWKAIWSSK